MAEETPYGAGRRGIAMRPGLNEFVGTWHLHRRIEDRSAGQLITLIGTAVFAPVDGGLHYREEGWLYFPGQAPIKATRSYYWHADKPGIAVMFEDGRPFHRFDPGADTPGTRHDCPPDTYDVRYDFTTWPIWRAFWSVNGPRKDYGMVSCYAPGAGAETGK